MRKTVPILSLLDHGNNMLQYSATAGEAATPEMMKGFRRGVCVMLEKALMDADAYEGYRYLSADEVLKGQEPGIVRYDDDRPPDFPDTTRRQYFVSRKLTD